MDKQTTVTKEEIRKFLFGHDDTQHILKIEGNYTDEKMSVIYRDENGVKKVSHEPYYPFCWGKRNACLQLYGGNGKKIKMKLAEYGIEAKLLRMGRPDGTVPERMENGYNVLFRAKFPMSYQKFMSFFREGGRPLYPKEGNANYNMDEYFCVAPNEQFMIATGKRLFKGYENYDDLLRMQFDLETEGLDPNINAISQIGIRTNKGYEKILTVIGEGEEREHNEYHAIMTFFRIIKEIRPDVISGHNTENFDWKFINVRLAVLRGSSLEAETTEMFGHRGIYKSNKEKVLKLGGEQEYYFPTIMWGTHLTDSLFAVRRAQALNSNIKKADLKYITKFAKLNKPNRVYVPGKVINSTWEDIERNYAFNDDNGKWFKLTKQKLNSTFDNNGVECQKYSIIEEEECLYDNENNEKYEFVTGRYIVERYLLDDLYETDKVELSFNQTNYQITKMLPVSFDKMCTMGTAAIWKYIMCAWSYENKLAIPELIERKRFTGGLSRLLVTGYVNNIIKLDYNSLYPSIILTHDINSEIDIMGAMSSMLEYILTTREEYKGEKKKYDKLVRKTQQDIDENGLTPEKERLLNGYKSKFTLFDNMQGAIKVIGNGFFGSYGSGRVFPWSDMICAENTTCVGRMSLRLMISWFKRRGYVPLVGDSFTKDTPIFIKYKLTNLLNILPISEIFNENNYSVDGLGREYDTSEKSYLVLCRSGWVEPKYVYRHKCGKDLYRVTEGEVDVTITEDHSLFDVEHNKIAPTHINGDTHLEYSGYNLNGYNFITGLSDKSIEEMVRNILERVDGKDYIPIDILNGDSEIKEKFIHIFRQMYGGKINLGYFSKTFMAGWNFIQKNS